MTEQENFKDILTLWKCNSFDLETLVASKIMCYIQFSAMLLLVGELA